MNNRARHATQKTEQLHALLSDIAPELAEPALQPLERLVARGSAGDALIVAIVGPSGVGKSELINLLASSRVVTAGPLRPTTTEIAVWGDIADTYLPGRRVPGPNRPDRVVLIDTPPAEHYPDTIAGLLHLVDAEAEQAGGDVAIRLQADPLRQGYGEVA